MNGWRRPFWRFARTSVPATLQKLPQFYLVRNEDGEYLRNDLGLDLRLGLGDGPDPDVLLCIAAADRNFGFLIANGKPLFVEGLPMAGDGAAIPLRIERDHAAGTVRLVHPFERGRRLRRRGSATQGELELHHCGPDRALAFQLEPAEAGEVPIAVRELGQEIDGVVRLPARYQDTLDALRNGELRFGIGEALLSRLPLDELQSLAKRIAICVEDRDTVRRCLGKRDQWLGQRLKMLAEWRADPARKAASVQKVDSADFPDLPNTRAHLSHNPGLGLTLHTLTRYAIKPRRMACVMGSARNEGAYMLEWIAHHRAVGFDHVFIYTNDNDDGSDELLGLLANAGVVSWVQSKIATGVLPQFQAYAHALSVKPETLDYRWALIADLDEYFGHDPSRFASVGDFLGWHETIGADAIALPWLIHVAGREDRWNAEPCPRRFPARETTVNHHIKTIFRTNMHWSATCHYPYATLWMPRTWRGDDGKPHMATAPENNLALARNPRATHGWIAHYVHKSASDLVMKLRRGKGDSTGDAKFDGDEKSLKHFIQLTRRAALTQDDRTERCSHRIDEELTWLRAIPGVAMCEADIRDRYVTRMNEACIQFLRQDFGDNVIEIISGFRSVLREQRHRDMFTFSK
jgi:hypothetical protein